MAFVAAFVGWVYGNGSWFRDRVIHPVMADRRVARAVIVRPSRFARSRAIDLQTPLVAIVLNNQPALVGLQLQQTPLEALEPLLLDLQALCGSGTRIANGGTKLANPASPWLSR